MKSFKTPQRANKTKLPAKHYRLGTTAEYVREFNRLNHYSNAGGLLGTSGLDGASKGN